MRTSSNARKSNVNIPIYRGEDNFASLNAFDYYDCLRRIRGTVAKDQLFDLTLGEAAKIARHEPKYFQVSFGKK